MNGSIGFFDRSADVGARILDYLAGTPEGTDITAYVKLVANIYKIFGQIHDSISDVAIEVSMAKDLPSARTIMERLRQMGLKDNFKAQDLCDQLQELGEKIPNTLLTLPNLDTETRTFLQDLSVQLVEREAGTARLYDEKLFDLRNLAYTQNDLPMLKAEVEAISQQLVLQKARFDYLARKARHMLPS